MKMQKLCKNEAEFANYIKINLKNREIMGKWSRNREITHVLKNMKSRKNEAVSSKLTKI